MARLNISVTRLSLACEDDESFRALLSGGPPPPVKPTPSDYVPVGGIEFHDIAEHFIRWLRDPLYSAETDDLVRQFDIWQVLSTKFAGIVIDKLLHEGQISKAANLTEALQNFSERLSQLRVERPSLRVWRDIFFSEEEILEPTMMQEVSVAGRADCLRLRADGSIEIVDYKLTQGNQIEKECCQLAIYAEMFRHRNPDFSFVGVLEYFLPKLHVTEISENDLSGIFARYVEPVIACISGNVPKRAAPSCSHEKPIGAGNRPGRQYQVSDPRVTLKTSSAEPISVQPSPSTSAPERAVGSNPTTLQPVTTDAELPSVCSPMLSTSAIARNLGVKPALLFNRLHSLGYIHKENSKWILSPLGVERGGCWVTNPAGERWIVWPHVITASLHIPGTQAASQTPDCTSLEPGRATSGVSDAITDAAKRKIIDCVSEFDGKLTRTSIARILSGSESTRLGVHRNSRHYGRLHNLRMSEVRGALDRLLVDGVLVMHGKYVHMSSAKQ